MPKTPRPRLPPKKNDQPARPAAEWMHISDVHPWAKNPRVNDAVVPKIVASIMEWGFPSTLVLNVETGDLIAGHTRLKAMEKILANDPAFTLADSPGPGYVPVRRHRFRDEAHAFAYALADNRLGEDARWDDALLRDVGRELYASTGDPELYGVIGFSPDEIAMRFDDPPLSMGDDKSTPPTPGGAHVSPTTGGGATPAHVRMVQLFYDETTHPEFVQRAEQLATKYGTKNHTDTVLEALRHACAQAAD